MYLPNLFEFSDYRSYLREIYTANKALNARFSFRMIAAKAGFSSSASYKLVIEGKRNLSKQSILQLTLGFGLDPRSAEYFENLVFYNQSEDPRQKDHFWKGMMALQKAPPIAAISVDHMEYFSQWYHCVIREIAPLMPLPLNYRKLGSSLSPRIQASEAQASVELLLDLGFLRLEGACLVQSEPVIGAHERTGKNHIVDFQKQMLQRALEAFERDRPQERLGSSTTLGVSEQTYAQMVQMTREFRAQLMEMARKDPHPQRVYQLAIHLFPLSEVVVSHV